jgi:hypothetical protein
MNALMGNKSPRDISQDYKSSEPKSFGAQMQAQAANNFRDLLKNAQMQSFSKPNMLND